MKDLQNSKNPFVFTIALRLFYIAPITAFAASDSPLVDNYINPTVIYAFTTAISFILLLGYLAMIKVKEISFILLYSSVFLVNAGYLMSSMSTTVSEALMANRISYLGAVFLPLLMLLIIMDVCRIKQNRFIITMLIAISIIIFLIAASPGYSTVYYKEVYLVFVNGAAKLKKVYGPLHKLYYIYLFGYFALMIGVIIHAWIKKKLESIKLAGFILTVTLLNIGVWFLEQQFRFNFEFLSVSYIATELFLLFIYIIIDEYRANALPQPAIVYTMMPPQPRVTELPLLSDVDDEDESPVVEKPHITAQDIISVWPRVESLTAREMEVFMYMVENKRRKDIADEMCVTENTIKKHTSHIFEKLNITSRAEIQDRLRYLNIK